MWWVNYWIMCDLIQAPTPDKGQLIFFFSLVSLYNLSKNEYSIFLPLWWVNYVRPHAGPHPLGPLNILFLLVSFHIIPKNEYSTFLFKIPSFQKVRFLFQWKTVYLIIHKFTLIKWPWKILKGRGLWINFYCKYCFLIGPNGRHMRKYWALIGVEKTWFNWRQQLPRRMMHLSITSKSIYYDFSHGKM